MEVTTSDLDCNHEAFFLHEFLEYDEQPANLLQQPNRLPRSIFCSEERLAEDPLDSSELVAACSK